MSPLPSKLLYSLHKVKLEDVSFCHCPHFNVHNMAAISKIRMKNKPCRYGEAILDNQISALAEKDIKPYVIDKRDTAFTIPELSLYLVIIST